MYVAGDNRSPDGSSSNSQVRHTRPLARLDEREMARWLSRASIYALPARYEPFGLSVLEAALTGCALVLGDIPSLREGWGDDAWFVPPDDAGRLADAVRTLVHTPTLRNEMARRASVRARRYTPQRMAAQYVDAYGSMLRDAARRSLPAAALSF